MVTNADQSMPISRQCSAKDSNKGDITFMMNRKVALGQQAAHCPLRTTKLLDTALLPQLLLLITRKAGMRRDAWQALGTLQRGGSATR